MGRRAGGPWGSVVTTPAASAAGKALNAARLRMVSVNLCQERILKIALIPGCQHNRLVDLAETGKIPALIHFTMMATLWFQRSVMI